MFAGFPGEWRSHGNHRAVDFPGRVALGFIEEPGLDQFSCYLDPAYRTRDYSQGFDHLQPKHIEGMSGGPAFLVRKNVITVPQLCGILKEGRDLGNGDRLFFFAPVACVSADGHLLCT
jgi:hypothetical protein